MYNLNINYYFYTREIDTVQCHLKFNKLILTLYIPYVFWYTIDYQLNWFYLFIIIDFAVQFKIIQDIAMLLNFKSVYFITSFRQKKRK